jgi:hypothetical protein
MSFLDRLGSKRPPMFTLPTLPMPGPRTPAPQPVMPVIGGPEGIGGTAPIQMPTSPAPMPGPAPMPMPVPPEGSMPVPVRGGTLRKLMRQRDQLQARLEQVNARIQQLMQGQDQGSGSGFPERKPQEGIGNLLEQLLRNQSERGDFGD